MLKAQGPVSCAGPERRVCPTSTGLSRWPLLISVLLCVWGDGGTAPALCALWEWVFLLAGAGSGIGRMLGSVGRQPSALSLAMLSWDGRHGQLQGEPKQGTEEGFPSRGNSLNVCQATTEGDNVGYTWCKIFCP